MKKIRYKIVEHRKNSVDGTVKEEIWYTAHRKEFLSWRVHGNTECSYDHCWTKPYRYDSVERALSEIEKWHDEVYNKAPVYSKKTVKTVELEINVSGKES